MTTITLDDLRGKESVVAAVEQLDRADAKRDAVLLDFSRLNGEKQERIAPQYGAILGNLIASRYADLPLVVQFPDEPVAQLQLARSGLLFALARHRSVEPGLSSTSAVASTLQAWRADWRPGDYQLALFDYNGPKDSADHPYQLDRNLLAFLNPDRMRPRQRELSTDALMHPWLSDLMTQKSISTTRDWRRHLSHEASFITTELLDNVRYHARLRTFGLCSMTAFTTGDSRLYLTVSDTGIGVANSLRQRFETSTLASFTQALDGTLPAGPRGSGWGLSDIVTRLNRLGKSARFFCASGPGTEGVGAFLVDHYGSLEKETPEVKYAADLAMQGTIIMVTLPLQQPADFEL